MSKGQVVVSLVSKRFIRFELPNFTRYGESKSLDLEPGTYRLTCVGFVPEGGFSVEKALKKGAYFNLDILTFTVNAGQTTSLEVHPVIHKTSTFFVKFFVPELAVTVTENGVLGVERVINERLVSLGAERAGVRIGDKQLADRIAAEPAFQEDGKFSKKRYDAIAQAQGFTAVGLDERLRQDMRVNRYRDAVMQTAIVPRSTLDGFIRLSEQSREVSVITITPEPFLATVKPTEEQIKAYYDARAKEFAVPEQVRVEYVELSVDALAARTPADPEEVKKF